MPLHQVFFYLTVLLLPTQLGYHFWPDWALVIGRRLDYLSPTLYITDITIFLTLASWFVSLCIRNLKNSKIHIFKFISNCKFQIKNYKIWGIVMLFVTFNVVLAASPIVALSKWFKVLEIILFGLYIIKTKPSFSRSMWCLLIAVFYSSCIAIAQFFLQHTIGGPLWFLGERTFDITTPGIARIQSLFPSILLSFYELRTMNQEFLRPYATFPHPNVLGGFLAVVLPLIMYQCFNLTNKKKNKINKFIIIFSTLTVALGVFTLLITFSRSAWIVGAIGLVIISLLFFRSIKNPLFVSFVVFVGFVGLFFTFPYFQYLTRYSESIFVRNELVDAAYSIWYASPIIGTGLGNFLVELPKYYPHREIFFLQPVHNIYLLMLSETGVTGIIFCVFLLWKLFKHITRKSLFAVVHLSLVILLLLGIVDHYPITLQQGQLLLAFLISFSLL